MNLIKYLLVIVLFSTTTIDALAQQAGHQHEEHLSGLLGHYLAVKDALAKDDYSTAQVHMKEFRKEVKSNSEMNNHEEHTGMHDEHHGAMLDAVDNATQAGNIKELRAAFKDISTHLAMALENQGYDTKTLYIQYCPMADGGNGASWISDEEKIVNPYMGQKMPGCGMAKETVNSDAR